MAKVLVWVKEPHQKAKHTHISVTSENLHKWLGDYSEAVFSTDMHILHNSEMVFTNMQYNCTICNQMFFGTIILIGKRGDTFTDCPMDKNDIRKYLPQLMKEG